MWIGVQVLFCTCCVNLAKSLNLSEPQFPHLQNGNTRVSASQGGPEETQSPAWHSVWTPPRVAVVITVNVDDGNDSDTPHAMLALPCSLAGALGTGLGKAASCCEIHRRLSLGTLQGELHGAVRLVPLLLVRAFM